MAVSPAKRACKMRACEESCFASADGPFGDRKSMPERAELREKGDIQDYGATFDFRTGQAAAAPGRPSRLC
jgi:hypothetical protein